MTTGDTPCDINRKARLIEDYLSGATPRELRVKFDVPLTRVLAEVGVFLWSRPANGRRWSVVDQDRPEVAARITDPLARRTIAIMAKSDHHAGQDVGQLSAAFELTKETIRYLIAMADAEILRRVRAGEPAQAIAAELGVNSDDLAAWIPGIHLSADDIDAVASRSTHDMPSPTEFQVTAAIITEYREAMGCALRERRVRRRLKVKQVALRLGISDAQVYSHETGIRDASSAALLKYAALYRVTPAVLVAEAFAAVVRNDRNTRGEPGT